MYVLVNTSSLKYSNAAGINGLFLRNVANFNVLIGNPHSPNQTAGMNFICYAVFINDRLTLIDPREDSPVQIFHVLITGLL